MSESTSVSFRLRRTTTEVAYVSVPVTKDLLVSDGEDPNTFRLNTDKLIEAAVALGRDVSTNWRLEGESIIELHPLQKPPQDSQGSGQSWLRISTVDIWANTTPHVQSPRR